MSLSGLDNKLFINKKSCIDRYSLRLLQYKQCFSYNHRPSIEIEELWSGTVFHQWFCEMNELTSKTIVKILGCNQL